MNPTMIAMPQPTTAAAQPGIHRSSERIHRFRSAAVAVALALATFATPGLQAHAADNGPTDPGVRCAAKIGPGQYEFYLPGERATDTDGNKWVCGPDGQWFRDYSAAIRAPSIDVQRFPRFQQVRTQLSPSSTATFR